MTAETMTAGAAGPVTAAPAARLRDTQFGWLWVNAVAFTMIATAERFTFVWLVIETLDGPSWSAGAVLFCLGLPVFLLVLHAGALADRYDRRRLLLTTQAAGVIVTALAAVMVGTGVMTVHLALLPAAALGCAMAFGLPIRSSLVSAVVPRELLMRAIVTNTVGVNVAMIVGPVIGGLAVRRFGIAWAFALESLLFAVGFLAVRPLRLPPPAPPPAPSAARPVGEGRWETLRHLDRSIRASIAEGLRFVWSSPSLRALFFLLTVGGFLMMGASAALLPQIARDEFGKDADAASALFAFMGVGMTGTSLFILTRRTLGRRGLVFLVFMVGGTLGQVLQGFAPTYAVLAGLMVLWGITGGWYVNLNQTLIQAATPLDTMGRVMSLNVLANSGLAPLGSLLAGALAGTALGVRGTYSLFGAIGLVCVLGTLAWSRSLRTLP
jgi:MFS family permease